MICVFLRFVLGDDPTIKMFGLGLAIAVFVDATIVRMVLVPATMELLGDANWWLPRLARPASCPTSTSRAARPARTRVRGRIRPARRARSGSPCWSAEERGGGPPDGGQSGR